MEDLHSRLLLLHPRNNCSFFADDGNLQIRAQHAAVALHEAMQTLQKANLTVQPAKTEIYSPKYARAEDVPGGFARIPETPPGVKPFQPPPQEVRDAVSRCWSHEGIVVAGTPIGTPNFCTEKVIAKVKKMVEVLGYVNQYASDCHVPYAKHGAMVMLRLCILSRLLHIPRTVIFDPKPSLLLHPQELPPAPMDYNNPEIRRAL